MGVCRIRVMHGSLIKPNLITKSQVSITGRSLGWTRKRANAMATSGTKGGWSPTRNVEAFKRLLLHNIKIWPPCLDLDDMQ